MSNENPDAPDSPQGESDLDESAPGESATGDSAPGESAARLAREPGVSIAYHRLPGSAPGIVFLGGYASDMTGTKAVALEAFARERGQAFLRFDYQGHGQSSGDFADGTIGIWAEDALGAFDALTEGPQVLIGSSMGGWIMLLTALARRERVAGLLGLAPAPDFTEDLMWAAFDAEQRATLERDGRLEVPSDYGDEPYLVTHALIEDGRERLLLRDAIPLDCPIRLIHGMADKDVPWQTSIRIAQQVVSEDVEIELVKGAGHRLSEPDDLARLEATLEALLQRVEAVSNA